MANISKCVWFTGLPCSGKTTLTDGLRAKLLEKGLSSIVLDGDVLRRSLNSDLGFDIVIPISAEHGEGLPDLYDVLKNNFKLITLYL